MKLFVPLCVWLWLWVHVCVYMHVEGSRQPEVLFLELYLPFFRLDLFLPWSSLINLDSLASKPRDSPISTFPAVATQYRHLKYLFLKHLFTHFEVLCSSSCPGVHFLCKAGLELTETHLCQSPECCY